MRLWQNFCKSFCRGTGAGMAGVSGGLSGTHEIAAREDKAFSVGEKISAYNVRNSGAEVSQRVWKEIKARCRTIEPNWRQVSQRV